MGGLDLVLTMPSSQNSVQLWLYEGGVGEVTDTFLLWAKVATPHASHGARQGHLFCPLRPSFFDTPATESERNQFLFALIDIRTLPGGPQKKSHILTNLEAHGFLIVQFTSLPFWMILNSLHCLCKDKRPDIFSSKAFDITTTIILNAITCHLIPLSLSVLVCKMKEYYLMSLPVILRFCTFYLLPSYSKLCL